MAPVNLHVSLDASKLDGLALLPDSVIPRIVSRTVNNAARSRVVRDEAKSQVVRRTTLSQDTSLFKRRPVIPIMEKRGWRVTYRASWRRPSALSYKTRGGDSRGGKGQRLSVTVYSAPRDIPRAWIHRGEQTTALQRKGVARYPTGGVKVPSLSGLIGGRYGDAMRLPIRDRILEAYLPVMEKALRRELKRRGLGR